MLTRFNNKVFSDLLESKTPFILMVYFMNQGKKKESGNGFYDMLTLYPSFIEKYDDKKDNKLQRRDKVSQVFKVASWLLLTQIEICIYILGTKDFILSFSFSLALMVSEWQC